VKLLDIQSLPRGKSSEPLARNKSFVRGCKPDRITKPDVSDRGNILMFDNGVGLPPQNEPQQSQLAEVQRMAAIGRMACSLSHDLRHSLTAIYANAEFLERQDMCHEERTDLLLDIQEAVLAMTARLNSLLQFGSSGQTNPQIRQRVSSVVEKAIASVKRHPDARYVAITVGTLPHAQAEIDPINLESAIHNLLLNACQAAVRSGRVPAVEVKLTEVEGRILITILDNGAGILASVRSTLFDPFVTAGKPNGTGLGLTLARRIAKEHGGDVWLEQSNGDATAFTLVLPNNRILTLEDLIPASSSFPNDNLRFLSEHRGRHLQFRRKN
jgi:signal transduction histidine kinase